MQELKGWKSNTAASKKPELYSLVKTALYKAKGRKLSGDSVTFIDVACACTCIYFYEHLKVVEFIPLSKTNHSVFHYVMDVLS